MTLLLSENKINKKPLIECFIYVSLMEFIFTFEKTRKTINYLIRSFIGSLAKSILFAHTTCKVQLPPLFVYNFAKWEKAKKV